MIGPMTTERPTASADHLLRRRSGDRVVGGVAGGLGDFLNIDPLLIRIGFVGLMVFGGLGLLLYLAAWALIPDDTTDRSIAEQLLDRVGLTTNRFLMGLLLLAGLFLLISGVGYEFGFGLGATIVVIVIGTALLRPSERHATVARAPAAKTGKTAAVEAPARIVARRRRRPRSPLGWYVLGSMLVGIGLLALATNVSGTDVDLGQFFGLALGVIGIGLVVGTWWGHARLLILLGILLLPFGIAASFVTVPIEGGVGELNFFPSNGQELRDEYRLVGGQIFLDLTEVEGGNEPITVSASVALGEIQVLLPEDASMELNAAVGGGGLHILNAYQSGTRLEDRFVIEGDGTRFVLDLEAGLGMVRVDTRQTEGG
jgi:phage shock protein PspC (stress-responsive transcriptional regulator)